jgi:hypothetical protein
MGRGCWWLRAGREPAGQVPLDGRSDVTDHLVAVESGEGADTPDVAGHRHADQLGGDEPGPEGSLIVIEVAGDGGEQAAGEDAAQALHGGGFVRRGQDDRAQHFGQAGRFPLGEHVLGQGTPALAEGG